MNIEKISYIYKHTRLDNNEVFYIGMSTLKNHKRAFNTINRSPFWHNVVCKTKYEVEIMIDNLSIDEAKEKEREFILFYGRKDNGTGTLVNLTDGGDGICGCKRTKETIEKRKNTMLIKYPNGLKLTNEQIEKRKNTMLEKKKNGYKIVRSKYSTYKQKETMVEKKKNGYISPIKGRKVIKSPEHIKNNAESKWISIIQYDRNFILIKEWPSIKEAAKELDINPSNISTVCNLKRKTAGGYIFRYKHDRN